MSFVDKVNVTVKAGDGGDGKLSFRHEKYVAKGGPDGGDGGDGGDIIFIASSNQNTLTAFRYQKEVKSEPGIPGDRRRMHGRNGPDQIVAVPVGTIITRLSNGNELADLTVDGQSAIIAQGGKGGFGNAHFMSSRRQAPNFAEKGEAGEFLELQLELKMIADVGLVGMPNAGKSTLLSKISNARPEIADYPFTTLTPNLGVVDIDKKSSVLFADIPGLIEGAAIGKGLGHAFLRHVERTAVILHLIDSYNPDVVNAYVTITEELAAYSKSLGKRPVIVALTKIEGLDKDIVDDLISQLEKVVAKGTKIYAISSLSGEGLKPLLYEVAKEVKTYRAKTVKKVKKNTIPVLTLNVKPEDFIVEKEGDIYIVRGEKIEQFAGRTNFDSEEGVQRLRDIMRRQGVMHELRRQDIDPDNMIQVGDNENQAFPY
jgi:GTP-binding protein